MAKIIAEFCQNHNGDFELLTRMIEEASKSGATHGKMQTIFAKNISFRPQFEEGLIQDGVVKSIKRPYYDEYKRLKSLEISYEQMGKFIKICNDNGLIPMTTCFSRDNINSLVEQGFNSIKVASYDCASFPMIKELANNFDELVISTGATYDDEIKDTARLLCDKNFSFLHCVTLYPTPLDRMHMARMEWLKELNPEVGYSDHSLVSETGLLASKAALALGASVIERHFTILAADKTKDGPISINAKQLDEISKFSKLDTEEMIVQMDKNYPNWRVVIGEKYRRLSDEELLNRDYYRGRFASLREESVSGSRMINNWESTTLI
jgi:N,N'-diacetyllegionaminate synthase